MMNKEDKVRRCKFCGKLLLDRKTPFCRRCTLEGRNKATQIGGIIGGVVTAVVSANALAEEHLNDNSSV